MSTAKNRIMEIIEKLYHQDFRLVTEGEEKVMDDVKAILDELEEIPQKVGSITTLIKPDIENGKAVFHVDRTMTESLDIVAGEMMLITFKEGKLIIEYCDW